MGKTTYGANKNLVVSLPICTTWCRRVIIEHPHVQIVEHHELMFNNSKARLCRNYCQNYRHLNVAGKTWQHLGGNNSGNNSDDSGDLAENTRVIMASSQAMVGQPLLIMANHSKAKVSHNLIHTIALACVENYLYFQSQHYRQNTYSSKAGSICTLFQTAELPNGINLVLNAVSENSPTQYENTFDDSGNRAENSKVCDNIVANVVTDFAPRLALKARKNDTYAIAKGGVNFVDSGNLAENHRIVGTGKATTLTDNGLSVASLRGLLPTIYNRVSFRAIVDSVIGLALRLLQNLPPIQSYLGGKIRHNNSYGVITKWPTFLKVKQGFTGWLYLPYRIYREITLGCT